MFRHGDHGCVSVKITFVIASWGGVGLREVVFLCTSFTEKKLRLRRNGELSGIMGQINGQAKMRPPGLPLMVVFLVIPGSHAPVGTVFPWE